MISSLKQAVQGMTIQMQRQDQIANNLANINTTGYKKSNLFASSIERYLTNDKQQVSTIRTIKADETYTDFSEGRLKSTGNEFDVALRGSGFFSVMTPHGIRYTRDGSFNIDAQGFLTTSTGDKVFGDDGFIRVNPEGGKVAFLDNGSVVQDSVEIDKLRITDFNKPYRLLKTGANYLRPELPNNPVRVSAGFAVKQGFLEGSNVEMVEEMTAMISSHRTYESIANAMKTQDDTLGKTVNSVGRVD